MPIPHYKDERGEYEIILSCPACHWAIVKDGVTKHWKECRLCGERLQTARVGYRPSTFEILNVKAFGG